MLLQLTFLSFTCFLAIMYKAIFFFFNRNILFLWEVAHNLFEQFSLDGHLHEILLICFLIYIQDNSLYVKVYKVLQTLTNECSHITTTTMEMQSSSLTLSLHCSFVVNPFPHHQPSTITELFSVPVNLVFLE